MKITPGRCLVCRCTDRWGCVAGCWWVDDWHTLCSRCAHRMAALALLWQQKGEGR